MFLTSQSHDIAYFHFLQPNQYVEGAKPISDEEAAVAINPKHPYRRAVSGGYPYMNSFGETLIDKGVVFTDLTWIFENNP